MTSRDEALYLFLPRPLRDPALQDTVGRRPPPFSVEAVKQNPSLTTSLIDLPNSESTLKRKRTEDCPAAGNLGWPNEAPTDEQKKPRTSTTTEGTPGLTDGGRGGGGGGGLLDDRQSGLARNFVDVFIHYAGDGRRATNAMFPLPRRDFASYITSRPSCLIPGSCFHLPRPCMLVAVMTPPRGANMHQHGIHMHTRDDIRRNRFPSRPLAYLRLRHRM
jgi:hypothetical protein